MKYSFRFEFEFSFIYCIVNQKNYGGIIEFQKHIKNVAGYVQRTKILYDDLVNYGDLVNGGIYLWQK